MVQTLRSTPAYAAHVPAEMVTRSEPRMVDLVTLLEWTYADQQAHLDLVSHDEERYLRSRCALAGLEDLLQLKTFVDGGGQSANLHVDADLVHGAVMDLAHQSEDLAYAAGLVIYYAAHRTTPEKPAMSDYRIERKLNGRGRQVMSYWQDGEEVFTIPNTKLPRPACVSGPGCRVGQACELVYTKHSAGMEAYLLEIYSTWEAVLEIIAGAIPLLITHKLKVFQASEQEQGVHQLKFCKRPLEMTI